MAKKKYRRPATKRRKGKYRRKSKRGFKRVECQLGRAALMYSRAKGYLSRVEKSAARGKAENPSGINLCDNCHGVCSSVVKDRTLIACPTGKSIDDRPFYWGTDCKCAKQRKKSAARGKAENPGKYVIIIHKRGDWREMTDSRGKVLTFNSELGARNFVDEFPRFGSEDGRNIRQGNWQIVARGKSNNPQSFVEITNAHVGKSIFRAFGKSWPTSHFIGRIMKQDIGKRVYLVGDILQVENNEQRNARFKSDVLGGRTKTTSVWRAKAKNPDSVIARWETRGNDWIELRRSDYVAPEKYSGPEYDGAYFYRGNGMGGGLPATIKNDAGAIAYMERPWGRGGAGPVTVLKSDRPSVKRVGGRR